MRSTAVLSLVASLGFGVSAFAGGPTVKELRDVCMGLEGQDGHVMCIGVLAGFRDGVSLSTSDDKCRYAVLSGAEGNRMKRLFLAWADANPSYWQEPMLMGLLASTLQEFPCLKANAPINPKKKP